MSAGDMPAASSSDLNREGVKLQKRRAELQNASMSHAPALFQRLSVHQRFSLRQIVGQEDGVVVAQGVVRRCRGDEVTGHNLLSLVDELVEGVLAVGAGLAWEKSWTRDCL